ncbi:MAG TPA: methyltransferase domain-containing protein [Planctomycetota bacterium]|nr:methyltransferase domain-containing protein [Planctomycetota bacterium]
MADLYDVFVDWEGRLGREMPGLLKRLREVGARRVLDAGCGTGRHVAALLREGFDAHGADVSEEMLEKAVALTGEPRRFHPWRMGDPPPDLGAPFDALLCLGNAWPQVFEVDATLAAFRRLVRPGGLVLVGLKAVEIRRAAKDPYMPLLKRVHEGRPLWFVRFVDFDAGDPAFADFHMVVVGDTMLHKTARVRVWGPETLRVAFERAGFPDVSVSARIGEPGVRPATEDVFVHARA